MTNKIRVVSVIFAIFAGIFGIAAPAHATGNYASATYFYAPGAYDGVSGCTVTIIDGPATGTFLCGSQLSLAQWADGRLEVSGLGTDHAVWTSWQTSPGGSWAAWSSLGGHDLQYRVYWPNSTTISSVGGDNRWWCRTYTSGWGPWYAC
ncbi:hypothetical protein OG689_38485 [Kitasatospora sp. NBC_00240]|uniref:hypothetical protein n=1 Tax=Kitasatospora sp. NBC_00240 TaxID=2903567 RepID=UPI00225B0398|nr:hypothetical protein [Kitasatospora sp. NBC_00240]MCX5215084.1 hypothetical protein [Kitasatospora sp. NBC_00240]